MHKILFLRKKKSEIKINCVRSPVLPQEKTFYEVREDIFTQSEIKIHIFFPISFPLKQLSHELTKSCENHFHEFCCLVKNPKKKLVPEKKKGNLCQNKNKVHQK